MRTLTSPEEELGGHKVLLQLSWVYFILFLFFFGGEEETEWKRTRGERKNTKNIRSGINLKTASGARQRRRSTQSAQNRIKTELDKNNF